MMICSLFLEQFSLLNHMFVAVLRSLSNQVSVDILVNYLDWHMSFLDSEDSHHTHLKQKSPIW